jgi:enamine deaminase RidA (YjgF/YER057c/UK114 family)
MLTTETLRAGLAELGLSLPTPPEARGRYLPAVADGDRLWVSGHTGRTAGSPATAGVVGRDLSTDDARGSARLAAVNLLAAALAAVPAERLGSVRILRGYVRAVDEFADHPRVVDAASEVLDHVLGPAGHARAAIGVASLPGGACVELEAVFGLRAALGEES